MHLSGEYREKLSLVLWETRIEMNQKGMTTSSEEAKPILSKVFKKGGFEIPNND